MLPTVDGELGALVRIELERHGVEVLPTPPSRRSPAPRSARFTSPHSITVRRSSTVGFVVVVVGVRPDVELAADAGAELSIKGAIAVHETMRPTLPDVFAVADCVQAHTVCLA